MVIQRVSRAEVRVESSVVGKISQGLLVLVGLEQCDGDEEVDRAVRRIATLRVFEDGQGKMNSGLDEIGGQVLAVSQFTLAASIRKGRRPGFDRAMPAEKARPLFDRFVASLRGEGVDVETGVFGAEMEVELVNDGPVTLIWDSSRHESSPRVDGVQC